MLKSLLFEFYIQYFLLIYRNVSSREKGNNGNMQAYLRPCQTCYDKAFLKDGLSLKTVTCFCKKAPSH